MKTLWNRISWIAGLAPTLLLGSGLLLGSACGSRVQDATGGETGFLGACGNDSDCRSGLCACGVCTFVCSEAVECSDARSMCASAINGNECTSEGDRVCIPKESGSVTATSAPETNTAVPSSGCEEASCNPTVPTPSSETSGSQTSTDCSDASCSTELRLTSPGEVELRVQVDGATCQSQCGGHAVSLFHGQQRELIVTDMLQCGNECPTPPPPVCLEVSTAPLIWDGRINIADSVQSCENVGSGSLPCEMEKRYLPPGRYTAQVCLGLLDALGCELSCFDVEFDFPASEPVTLSWVNDSTNGPADTSELTSNDAPSSSASIDASALTGSETSNDAGTQ